MTHTCAHPYRTPFKYFFEFVANVLPPRQNVLVKSLALGRIEETVGFESEQSAIDHYWVRFSWWKLMIVRDHPPTPSGLGCVAQSEWLLKINQFFGAERTKWSLLVLSYSTQTLICVTFISYLQRSSLCLVNPQAILPELVMQSLLCMKKAIIIIRAIFKLWQFGFFYSLQQKRREVFFNQLVFVTHRYNVITRYSLVLWQ